MELLGAKPKWYDFINLQTYDIWHDSYINIKEKNKPYKNVGHSLCIYDVIPGSNIIHNIWTEYGK